MGFMPKGVDEAWLRAQLHLPMDVCVAQAAKEASERVRQTSKPINRRDLDGRAIVKDVLNRYLGAWIESFRDPQRRVAEMSRLRDKPGIRAEAREALATLLPQHEEVYLFVNLVGYSQGQVAKIVDRTKDEVSRLHYEAQRMIQEYLAGRRESLDVV